MRVTLYLFSCGFIIICSPIICVYAVPSSSSVVSNVGLYKDELKSTVNLPAIDTQQNLVVVSVTAY